MNVIKFLVGAVVVGAVIGLIGGSVYRIVDAHSNAANCANEAEDINDSCNVTGVDVALVKFKVGVFYNTYTPSAVPSATPTPLFNVTELINDSNDICTNGSHVYCSGDGAQPVFPVQGSLCPPVNGYNWGISGHGLDGNGPTGAQETGWWTAQWTTCGDSATSVTIVITNFHNEGWTGSAWVDLGGDYDDWCSESDPNTTSNYSACSGSFNMPTGERALHGATDRVADQNVQCVAVYYKAKQTGTKPIMANAGSDHISDNGTTNTTADDYIIGDLFISRYKALNTSTDVQVGGTSCTVATVTNNLPPGF